MNLRFLRAVFPRSVLLLALLGTLAACSKQTPSDPAAAATPVRSASATLGPAAALIEANGLIGSRDEMRLSFKTGGIVQRIAVREGEAVRQGALLAELELTEIQSQAEQAAEVAAKAERDLERGERLHADQVISLEALQNLRTQAAVARAARAAARFNLGYSRITAPRDGVILRKLVEERELVPPGQPVVVLGSAERGYVVRFALSDRDIVQISLGDTAEITLDAYPGRSFTGRVSEISSAADVRTGLFPAQLQLDASVDLRLPSGLVAKLRLAPGGAAQRVLTYVPIASVVEGDGRRASVFVIDGDVARKREVQLAFLSGEEAVLLSGVTAGERVVTDGALYLVDGDRVRIVDGATVAAR